MTILAIKIKLPVHKSTKIISDPSLQSIREVKVNPLSFTLLQISPIKGLNINMLTHK